MRIWILVACLVALAFACGSDRPATPDARSDAKADAKADAPVDGPSGSAAAVALETSPKDSHLDLMVAGLCFVIVLGPMRRRDRAR